MHFYFGARYFSYKIIVPFTKNTSTGCLFGITQANSCFSFEHCTNMWTWFPQPDKKWTEINKNSSCLIEVQLHKNEKHTDNVTICNSKLKHFELVKSWIKACWFSEKSVMLIKISFLESWVIKNYVRVNFWNQTTRDQLKPKCSNSNPKK